MSLSIAIIRKLLAVTTVFESTTFISPILSSSLKPTSKNFSKRLQSLLTPNINAEVSKKQLLITCDLLEIASTDGSTRPRKQSLTGYLILSYVKMDYSQLTIGSNINSTAN